MTSQPASDPRQVPVLAPDDAVAEIAPDAVLTVSGVVGSLVPDRTLKALRRRLDRNRTPSGLTVLFPVAVGDVFARPGVDRLAHPELLAAVVGGSFVYGVNPETQAGPELARLLREGEVAAYNLPIGVMFTALREVAAGRPGLLTKVGLGTFQDPRNGGGPVKDAGPSRFVSVRDLDGEEFLHVRLPKPDVALVRRDLLDQIGFEVRVAEGVFA